MKFKQYLAAATLAATSVCATATPVYYGDTDAVNVTNRQIDTGYYLWNDENDASSWHLRWSSTNANGGSNVDWFGEIEFIGGGLVSALDFSFEGRDDLDVDFGRRSDEIEWETVTNDRGGIDGINFTIDNTIDLIRFDLGSTLFDGLSTSTNVASNIFIGDGFANPDVYVYTSGNGDTYQRFEVSVAEPGTLALLGLGLAGLGFARRKQA